MAMSTVSERSADRSHEQIVLHTHDKNSESGQLTDVESLIVRGVFASTADRIDTLMELCQSYWPENIRKDRALIELFNVFEEWSNTKRHFETMQKLEYVSWKQETGRRLIGQNLWDWNDWLCVQRLARMPLAWDATDARDSPG
jgi:DNA replication protein DnaD